MTATNPTKKRTYPARTSGVLRTTLRTPKGRIGAGLLVAVALVVVIGPLLAPAGPLDLVGPPFLPFGSPGNQFGTDFLGHDTLSRFLYGGRIILIISLISAIIGVGVGATLGLVAGYLKGPIAATIMRTLDVLLCFPSLVLTLLVASMIGSSLVLVCAIVALSHVPRTARVIHAATLQVAERDFVAYAETIGTSRTGVVVGELLPSLTSFVALELGLRTTWSIGIISSLGYLGLGVQPPAADWGLMINENQLGLTIQPWPVILPLIGICVATVGANLLTDAFSQTAAGVDRTIVSEEH